MSTSPFHIIIIGAGTGGLCLAQGLKQAGISVAVYERDRTRADGLYGYRVGINPDGSRALHACLPADLYDTFVATCARPPRSFTIFTENLSEVLSLEDPPSTDPINSEKSVSRMTLRQVLLTGLEDIVHFDKTFTRYEQHADGTVTAFFDDGTTASGTVLVAADGASSRVRQQYLPHAKLIDANLAYITGKVPLTDETRLLLPPQAFETVSMILAPRGYSCVMHVMEFKWDHNGNLKNGIGGNDSRLLAAWPGLLYDNTRDYIMFGVGASLKRFPADPLHKKGAELVCLMQDMTRNWHPNLRKLFSLTDPSTCFPINVRTSVPIAAWSSSSVTLIGDAIHTMTPGRGVGANTALRDAVLLRNKIIAAYEGRMTLIQAIHEYESQMIEYGFDAVRRSLVQVNGDGIIHKPVIGRVVLAGMRTSMRLANHIPPIKKRMADAQRRYRGADR